MRTTMRAIMLCLGMIFLPFSGWGMMASNNSRITLFNNEEVGYYLGIGASIDAEIGDMTYIIQGPEDGGWKSELEWPLEGILYLGGTVSFSFLERFQINAGMWKSLEDDAGTMKDSDWLYRDYGNEKAIYSETDATVEATQFDLNVRYDFLKHKNLALGTMVGYSYKKWEWEAGNGYQWSIDPHRFYTGAITGLGIAYKQEVKVPYLGLAFSITPPLPSAFELNVYTLYSSLAQCDDIDDHILRYKESKGQTEGAFLSVGGDLFWNFVGHWMLIGKINYTNYNLTGDQNQYFYAGEDAGLRLFVDDLTIEGSQFFVSMMISYSL